MTTLLLCVLLLGLLGIWIQWMDLERPATLDDHWGDVRQVLGAQAIQSE